VEDILALHINIYDSYTEKHLQYERNCLKLNN